CSLRSRKLARSEWGIDWQAQRETSMRKLLLGGVVLGALIAPPALAADMAVKAPPPVPVWTWTGCYIGVNAGVVWDRARYYNVQPNTIGFGQALGAFNPAAAPQYAAGLSNELTNTGFTGGGQIGCNYQFQTAVFGWESDFQYTGLDNTFTASL